MNTILTNGPVSAQQLENAAHILLSLQQELRTCIAQGSGPFLAAIYDEKGNLISQAANSVVAQNCSHCHAEMNAIKQAEEKLHTFDLAPHRLRLYVTSEPCLMCLGGILWSGIREVYFGVPSKRVEEITGFDEGFGTGWMEEFKKRGILACGNIEPQAGEEVLASYVQAGKRIYKPSR